MNLISVLVALFGVILSSLFTLGLFLLKGIIAQLRDMKSELRDTNKRMLGHLLESEIHAAGFAKTDERINALTNLVEVAHERIDKVQHA